MHAPRLFALIALTAVIAVPATAENLKNKKARKAAQARFEKDGYGPKVEKNCGTKIKTTIKWKAFDKKYEGSYAHSSTAAFCDSVLSAIAKLCKDPDGKEAVAKQIKKVTCTWDEKATKDTLKRYGPTLKIDKKGNLKVGFQWKTGNMDSATKEWLLNNLEG